MKPIFGIDLADKNDICTTSEPFVIYKASKDVAEALETTGENANQLLEKAKLPLWLRILEYVFGIAALLTAGGIVKADVSISQGYKNAPYIFWICGISIVLFAVIFVMGKIKSKSVLTDEVVTKMNSELEARERALYFEMDVPEYAEEVDVLFLTYKVKDGEPVPKEKLMALSPFINVSSKIYVQDGLLCVADQEAVYGFPISEMMGISTVNKKILIPSWNKETGYKKGIYKQYKMTENQYGIHLKPYHILHISHGDESYGLYFPCYELPVFERLTGLKAASAD